MTRIEAEQSVERYYNESDPLPERFGRWVVLPQRTIEKEYGWVCFVATSGFLETGDYRLLPVGNSPVLVLKEGGRFIMVGTAEPAETFLEDFEHRQRRGRPG